jgi:hypothetical protein
VELDDCSTALIAIGALPIERKAPRSDRWLWPGSEHALNGVMRGTPTEAHIADCGAFVRVKGRVFGLEIDNQLAHVGR